MNKLFLLCASSFLYAASSVYTYTVLLDYREYNSGVVIDKDYTHFGELNGIGIKFRKNLNPLKVSLKAEYAAGNSTYEGATWSGDYLKNSQSGVHILNIESGFGMRYFNFILGYREWNRGKSSYEGDYDEKYYWGYVGIKYESVLRFRRVVFAPKVAYEAAISPKMKVYLGNSPELKLGSTTGGYLELPLYFKMYDLVAYLFYRYQYWHISKSDYAVLQTDTQKTLIYEPESITSNQYFGVGVVFNF